MAEKIMARASGRASVAPGTVVDCVPDTVVCSEMFADVAAALQQGGVTSLFDPDRVAVVLDHDFPAPTVEAAERHRRARDLCSFYRIKHFLGGAGVSHQVLPERGLIHPGSLVLGGDSHCCTYGAFGAAGAGIGATELAYVLAVGDLWMQVPTTLRFDLVGTPGPGLMSKDLILYIAGTLSTGIAHYRAVEFHGPVARRMTMSGRWTMSNMGVEIGAKFAFFPVDDTTATYLGGRLALEPERFGPDPDAAYERIIEVDITSLEPQVACPHDVGNVRPVADVAGVKVDQVFLGSCTNGRLEDLEVGARMLDGRKVSSTTRLVVTPASQQVLVEATRAGFIGTLVEAGALITPSGCGACPGAHMGVIGPGEVCMSSTNRNFAGRMGSPEASVYLGSPATVVATAIVGEIADPRRFWSGTTLA
jgi:3-isopropylmalate/(R)-2-methylmalate dehydratase large subunit